jgi:hypothetical protein
MAQHTWRHPGDGIRLGRPHDEIDSTGKRQSHATIDPEQDNHSPLEPVSRPPIADSILGDVCQDCTTRDDRGRHEKRFSGMRKRGFEGRRVPVKAERYHDNVECEQDKVEDEEATANRILTRELIGHYIDKSVSGFPAMSCTLIPAKMTFANCPVAIVIVNHVQTKCRTRCFRVKRIL